jgi:hypothetical protein
MPGGRQDGVVAKDAAEVVLVGKGVFLQRQENAGRIDEVNQRQTIGKGDALRPQDFLGGHRKERAGFHGGVVGDDHVPPAANGANHRDNSGGGSPSPGVVHFVRGPQT